MKLSQYTKEHQGPRKGAGPHFVWTEEATALLIKRKRAGATRSEIARSLKKAGHGDYSPEAVCGRIFRLRRQGVSFDACDYSPEIPTLSTGAVLGTFLERLCDIGSWT